LFFTLLSAATVAALQTVGACLVIALVITPGSTAYLLTDRFNRLIIISMSIGIFTSSIGSYASFFLDLNPGGLIVCFQSLIFFFSFLSFTKIWSI
jgi:manganese/iron transport system permease protein